MSRLLCDTHILLWAAMDPDRLRDHVRDQLADPATEMLVSSVSIAEMVIKSAAGKLSLPVPPADLARQLGCGELPLSWHHVGALSGLPLLHRDPFDRLLIAQALAEKIPLVTADASILSYPDVVLIEA